MKIVLFVNSAKTFFWHRKPLADLLVDQGHDVTVICSRDGDIERFKNEKFKTILIDLSRKGKNPFEEIFILMNLLRIFLDLKPDLCHNFTVKCVIYGSLTQRLAGVRRIVNTITGLGIVFVKGGFTQFLVESLYRLTFKLSSSINIFQNIDDQKFFIEKRLLRAKSTRLVRGSGVDTSLFKPESKTEQPLRIVFASRLIRSKGALDLLEASVLLQESGIKHEVCIAGEFDPMNSDTLSEKDFVKYRKYQHIKFLGNVNSMHELLSSSHISCFPSYYREGVPKFLLESAACGLPIVTTNTPGCREVVDGNGYMVAAMDPKALRDSLELLINSPDVREEFGKKSRELALAHFSQEKTLEKIISTYEL